MESGAARVWLVNDLHRRRLPFAGYPLLAALAWVDPIVRRDGQLSVGRSFRRAEWAAMLAEALPDMASECRIFRSFPWRLCVEHIRRSEEHTSELQSLMRISYAVFCLKKKNTTSTKLQPNSQQRL